MFAANSYVVRPATEQDVHALRRLSGQNSRPPSALRCRSESSPGRRPRRSRSATRTWLPTRPYRPTTWRRICALRAGAVRALAAQPSLRERMLAVLPARLRAGPATAPAAEPAALEILRRQAATAVVAGWP